MSVFRVILIAIIIFLFSSTIMAQGDFLRGGQSGAEVLVGAITDDFSSGFGFQASFSLGGAVDLGFAVTGSKLNQSFGSRNIRAKSYSTFIVFH